MKQKVAPQSRKNEIVVQDLNGEVLIYDLKSNKAFCLNETSALVWQACDGTKSVSEISQAISKKLNEPANEDLVWLALDQLKQENLLENSDEIASGFNGMSRREAIRKVGLGTMIALPFVTGLIAPSAAMAQSLAAICAASSCDCADAFITGGAAPGTECAGGDLATPCNIGGTPQPACRCFVRDTDPVGDDICAP
jgi:hypothetical protein